MTTWDTRMVPADWPLYIHSDGRVVCGRDGCDEPIAPPMRASCQLTTAPAFLDALWDHITGDHGEAGA